MSDDQANTSASSQPRPKSGDLLAATGEQGAKLAALAVPGDALDRLGKVFERSARRWEMIVYPSIIALIALVGGAFFFIYTLTRDMRDLALQIQPQIGLNISKVADSVTVLSTSLDQMSRDIGTMRSRMEMISDDVNSMNKQMAYMKNLQIMNDQMAQMNASMTVMNAQANAMRSSMQSVNQSIARPMSMFNTFMPW